MKHHVKRAPCQNSPGLSNFQSSTKCFYHFNPNLAYDGKRALHHRSSIGKTCSWFIPTCHWSWTSVTTLC